MPNQSPYFTGAAPNFGPPSGMAALIGQDRGSQMDTSGFKQFADVAEKFKQQQDAGKAADYFVKANPDALTAIGVHPEQWKTLSSGDKSAAVTGLVKGQAMQEVMQRMADVKAQADERNAQTKAMTDTGTFLKSYAGDLPAGTEDTPQNRLANALKSMPAGADVGRVFPQAMSALEKFATIGANNGTPTFTGDTTTAPGWNLVGEKGSKQWQALPTGGANVQMVDDGNGNQVPVVVSPKGNVTQLKSGTKLNPKDALTAYNKNSTRLATLTTSLQMAQDPKFAGILDKDAIQAEMDDLKAQQATLKPVWQQTAPAAAAPQKPVPLPAAKADMKKGTLYQTSHGPATWDGTQFVGQ